MNVIAYLERDRMETVKIQDLAMLYAMFVHKNTIQFFTEQHSNDAHAIEDIHITSFDRNSLGAFEIKFSFVGEVSSSITNDMYLRQEYEKFRILVDNKIYECVCNSLITDYDADVKDNIYTSYITLEILED